MVTWLFVLLLALGAPAPQPGTAVVNVPTSLPPAIAAPLQATRTELLERVDAHNAKAKAFNARCARVAAGSAENAACGRDFAELQAAWGVLEADKKAFAKRVADAQAQACAPLQAQLDRDNALMAQLLHWQQFSLAEVQSGKAQALEAQKNAVLLGGKLLLSAGVKQMEGRAAAARTFKSWATRYEAMARQKGANVASLMAKADRALENYAKAAAAAEAGQLTAKGLDAVDLFAGLSATGRATFALQQRADADLRAAVLDPTVQSLGADLTRGILDTLSLSTELARFSPHYTLASFVVDYALAGGNWLTALWQIEGQSEVLGKQAQAMQAVQRQIARTTDKLKACRLSGGV